MEGSERESGAGRRAGECGAACDELEQGGFDQGDGGVGSDERAALGRDADEGVVKGVQDEGGNGDAAEDAGGGGAVVVVVGALEAGVEGGDFFVEVA